MQSWVDNSKPAILIRDHGRYLRLKPEERTAKLAEWNKPMWWPLALLVAAVVVGLVFARRSLRRRQRMNARSEVLAS